jgi:NADH:ubiquinone oxidoreductase subunit E
MSKIIEPTELTKKTIQEARDYLPKDVLESIDQAMDLPHSESYLIKILQKVQDHFGYITPESIQAVALLMDIPAAKISGVASFYHLFHLQPRGKFIISICTGTACYVKGVDKILERLHAELGIFIDETTTDSMFSIEQARCLGMCALAPIVKINDDIYTKVTPDDIPVILQKYVQ